MCAERSTGPAQAVTRGAGARASLLASRVSVPQSVVYRSFPSETVVLNLQSGRYHGLNATAGRMLEALERAPSVEQAAALLARSFAQPLQRVREDLCELCESLLARGLVSIDDQADSRS